MDRAGSGRQVLVNWADPLAAEVVGNVREMVTSSNARSYDSLENYVSMIYIVVATKLSKKWPGASKKIATIIAINKASLIQTGVMTWYHDPRYRGDVFWNTVVRVQRVIKEILNSVSDELFLNTIVSTVLFVCKHQLPSAHALLLFADLSYTALCQHLGQGMVEQYSRGFPEGTPRESNEETSIRDSSTSQGESDLASDGQDASTANSQNSTGSLVLRLGHQTIDDSPSRASARSRSLQDTYLGVDRARRPRESSRNASSASRSKRSRGGQGQYGAPYYPTGPVNIGDHIGDQSRDLGRGHAVPMVIGREEEDNTVALSGISEQTGGRPSGKISINYTEKQQIPVDWSRLCISKAVEMGYNRNSENALENNKKNVQWIQSACLEAFASLYNCRQGGTLEFTQKNRFGGNGTVVKRAMKCTRCPDFFVQLETSTASRLLGIPFDVKIRKNTPGLFTHFQDRVPEGEQGLVMLKQLIRDVVREEMMKSTNVIWRDERQLIICKVMLRLHIILEERPASILENVGTEQYVTKEVAKQALDRSNNEQFWFGDHSVFSEIFEDEKRIRIHYDIDTEEDAVREQLLDESDYGGISIQSIQNFVDRHVIGPDRVRDGFLTELMSTPEFNNPKGVAGALKMGEDDIITHRPSAHEIYTVCNGDEREMNIMKQCVFCTSPTMLWAIGQYLLGKHTKAIGCFWLDALFSFLKCGPKNACCLTIGFNFLGLYRGAEHLSGKYMPSGNIIGPGEDNVVAGALVLSLRGLVQRFYQVDINPHYFITDFHKAYPKMLSKVYQFCKNLKDVEHARKLASPGGGWHRALRDKQQNSRLLANRVRLLCLMPTADSFKLGLRCILSELQRVGESELAASIIRTHMKDGNPLYYFFQSATGIPGVSCDCQAMERYQQSLLGVKFEPRNAPLSRRVSMKTILKTTIRDILSANGNMIRRVGAIGDYSSLREDRKPPIKIVALALLMGDCDHREVRVFDENAGDEYICNGPSRLGMPITLDDYGIFKSLYEGTATIPVDRSSARFLSPLVTMCYCTKIDQDDERMSHLVAMGLTWMCSCSSFMSANMCCAATLFLETTKTSSEELVPYVQYVRDLLIQVYQGNSRNSANRAMRRVANTSPLLPVHKMMIDLGFHADTGSEFISFLMSLTPKTLHDICQLRGNIPGKGYKRKCDYIAHIIAGTSFLDGLSAIDRETGDGEIPRDYIAGLHMSMRDPGRNPHIEGYLNGTMDDPRVSEPYPLGVDVESDGEACDSYFSRTHPYEETILGVSVLSLALPISHVYGKGVVTESNLRDMFSEIQSRYFIPDQTAGSSATEVIRYVEDREIGVNIANCTLVGTEVTIEEVKIELCNVPEVEPDDLTMYAYDALYSLALKLGMDGAEGLQGQCEILAARFEYGPFQFAISRFVLGTSPYQDAAYEYLLTECKRLPVLLGGSTRYGIVRTSLYGECALARFLHRAWWYNRESRDPRISSGSACIRIYRRLVSSPHGARGLSEYIGDPEDIGVHLGQSGGDTGTGGSGWNSASRDSVPGEGSDIMGTSLPSVFAENDDGGNFASQGGDTANMEVDNANDEDSNEKAEAVSTLLSFLSDGNSLTSSLLNGSLPSSLCRGSATKRNDKVKTSEVVATNLVPEVVATNLVDFLSASPLLGCDDNQESEATEEYATAGQSVGMEDDGTDGKAADPPEAGEAEVCETGGHSLEIDADYNESKDGCARNNEQQREDLEDTNPEGHRADNTSPIRDVEENQPNDGEMDGWRNEVPPREYVDGAYTVAKGALETSMTEGRNGDIASNGSEGGDGGSSDTGEEEPNNRPSTRPFVKVKAEIMDTTTGEVVVPGNHALHVERPPMDNNPNREVVQNLVGVQESTGAVDATCPVCYAAPVGGAMAMVHLSDKDMRRTCSHDLCAACATNQWKIPPDSLEAMYQKEMDGRVYNYVFRGLTCAVCRVKGWKWCKYDNTAFVPTDNGRSFYGVHVKRSGYLGGANNRLVRDEKIWNFCCAKFGVDGLELGDEISTWRPAFDYYYMMDFGKTEEQDELLVMGRAEYGAELRRRRAKNYQCYVCKQHLPAYRLLVNVRCECKNLFREEETPLLCYKCYYNSDNGWRYSNHRGVGNCPGGCWFYGSRGAFVNYLTAFPLASVGVNLLEVKKEVGSRSRFLKKDGRIYNLLVVLVAPNQTGIRETVLEPGVTNKLKLEHWYNEDELKKRKKNNVRSNKRDIMEINRILQLREEDKSRRLQDSERRIRASSLGVN